MSKKKRLEEGDIFYVPYKGKYFFCKILIDISERILKKENINTLKFADGCYLVGIYKGVYSEPILESEEYIIPSIYVYKKYFYSKNYKIDWVFYRHEEIDYKQINFPESLIDVHEKGICFSKGELELPTVLTSNDYDTTFKVRKTINPSLYSVIDFSCYYQEKQELMNFIPKQLLDSQDFHFNPLKRKDVYRQIGEDENISYYDLSLKFGLDLGRFYK